MQHSLRQASSQEEIVNVLWFDTRKIRDLHLLAECVRVVTSTRKILD